MAVNGFLKASGTPERTFSMSVVGSRCGGDFFAAFGVAAGSAMTASGMASDSVASVRRIVLIERDLPAFAIGVLDGTQGAPESGLLLAARLLVRDGCEGHIVQVRALCAGHHLRDTFIGCPPIRKNLDDRHDVGLGGLTEPAVETVCGIRI